MADTAWRGAYVTHIVAPVMRELSRIACGRVEVR